MKSHPREASLLTKGLCRTSRRHWKVHRFQRLKGRVIVVCEDTLITVDYESNCRVLRGPVTRMADHLSVRCFWIEER